MLKISKDVEDWIECKFTVQEARLLMDALEYYQEEFEGTENLKAKKQYDLSEKLYCYIGEQI